MYMQTMLTGMALKYHKCIAEHRAISNIVCMVTWPRMFSGKTLQGGTMIFL